MISMTWSETRSRRKDEVVYKKEWADKPISEMKNAEINRKILAKKAAKRAAKKGK